MPEGGFGVVAGARPSGPLVGPRSRANPNLSNLRG